MYVLVVSGDILKYMLKILLLYISTVTILDFLIRCLTYNISDKIHAPPKGHTMHNVINLIN